jgi:proline dehydrogenase
MFRRTWQSGMIRLARSAALKRAFQDSRATSALAERYIAGGDAEAAIARAGALLSRDRIRSSLFYLGEYVDTRKLVAENVAAKLAAASLLGAAGLDVHVSVDPTQIGYGLDVGEARRNAFRIADAIAQHGTDRHGVHALMFDMEDQSVVDATISLHNDIRAAGLPVALTLQAYLRRTEADLAAQIRQGGRVRLVKGAFTAARTVAFTKRADIKANSRRLVDLMFSQTARDAGFYPIIATHDDRLQTYAITRAREGGWRAGDYEFEMLFGVRTELAGSLARQGERIRLYLPFGRDWWPYAMRRIGENPHNAWLLLRSLAAMPRSSPMGYDA